MCYVARANISLEKLVTYWIVLFSRLCNGFYGTLFF